MHKYYLYSPRRNIIWPDITEYLYGDNNFSLILEDRRCKDTRQLYNGSCDDKVYFLGWEKHKHDIGFKQKERIGDIHKNYVYLAIFGWALHSGGNRGRPILMLKVGKCVSSLMIKRAFENGAIVQVAVGEFPNGVLAKKAEKKILKTLSKEIGNTNIVDKVTNRVPSVPKRFYRDAIANFMDPKKATVEDLIGILLELAESAEIIDIIRQCKGSPIREFELFVNVFIENKKLRFLPSKFIYVDKKSGNLPIRITELCHIRGPFLIFRGISKASFVIDPQYYVIDLRGKNAGEQSIIPVFAFE